MEKKPTPSADEWLREAKAAAAAADCGMYLLHNGVVRRSAKAKARGLDERAGDVSGMQFSYDREKAAAAIREAEAMEGIRFVRVWLAEGRLNIGDDIMYVLVGGDIRPHVIDALQALVGKLKNECVTETELT